MRLVSIVAALSIGAGTSPAGPPGDDARYRAGLGLLEKGVHDLAAAELEAFLRDHAAAPEAAGARYALGVCYARLGRHADAARELERVASVEGFEFAADAALLRARCAMALGEHSSAAAMLGAFADEHAGFAGADRAAALRGEALYRAGEHEACRRVLSGFAETWPQSAERDRADLFCAMAEAALGRSSDAAARAGRLRGRAPGGPYVASAALVEARCRHALGEHEAAWALYRAAAESADESVRDDAALGAAQVARARGDVTGAQEWLDSLRSRDVARPLRDAAEIERARLLYDLGRFDDALRALDAIDSAAGPGAADHAEFWRARCELAQSNGAAAAARLERAAGAFPASPLLPEMLFDRAAALSRAGDEEASLAAWAEWEERFPGHRLLADAVGARAGALHRLDRFEESGRACAEFLRRWPSHERAAGVALLAIENEFLSGRFGAALVACEAFLRDHAADAGAWQASVRRGLCLANLGRAPEAAEALGAAVARADGRATELRTAALAALGEIAFDAGDWAGAERWYGALTREIATGPGAAECALRLGLSIARQGRGRDAIGALERAEGLGGDSATARHARFERAQVLVELGDPGAPKVLESVVRDGDGEPDELSRHALRHLAAIASREGRGADAAALLARASDGSVDAVMQQAGAWMSAGRFDEAERAYERAATGGGPRSAEAQAGRAIAMSRQGRAAEAIEALDECLRDPARLDPESLARARYERAVALRAAGRDEDAASAYRELLESDPPRVLSCYAALDLAQIETAAGRHAEAIVLLDRCRGGEQGLEASAASALVERETYLRGACLLALGKAVESARVLESFHDKFPESELRHHAALTLGEARVTSGRSADAAATLAALVESGPPAEIAAPALIRLGDARVALQRWSEAESAYTSHLDRFGDGPLWYKARFGQGWCREQQGRHEAAIEAYRDVAARHGGPTAARAQFQVGECLYAMKRHAEAVAELLKVDVLFAHPEWSAAALYEAGRCLTEMGRGADAARQFQDVTEKFPDSKWAALARERIEAARPAPLPGRVGAAGPE